MIKNKDKLLLDYNKMLQSVIVFVKNRGRYYRTTWKVKKTMVKLAYLLDEVNKEKKKLTDLTKIEVVCYKENIIL